MSLINRSVVIVVAKQPFIDWVNATLSDNVTLEEANTGSPAFLIEDFESDEDLHQAVYDEWAVYFETWLESWVPDANQWPKHRTLDMFKEWFDIALHPMVFDRLDEPVTHEDDVDSGEPAPHRGVLH